MHPPRRLIALSFLSTALSVLSVMAPAPARAQEGGFACTQIGCVDGLTVAFPFDYRWEPGAYRFLMTLDGESAVCVGRLPLRPCDKNSVTCNHSGVMIGESGCALPPESHGFSEIMFMEAPENLEIRVERGGEVIFEKSMAPAYREHQPNGPNCGPVCRSAREELQPVR